MTDALTADELEQIRQDLDPSTDLSAAAALEAQQEAEDQAIADALGIDAKFVAAGRQFDENPEELAALDGCRSAADVEAAMTKLAAKREARAEAKRQALVTAEAKRLS